MTSHTLNLLEFPVRRTITESFWTPHSSEEIPDAYWAFYAEECDHAFGDDGSELLIQTHQDILDTVAYLKSSHSRDETREFLRQKFSGNIQIEDASLERSIDLCATLLLMVDFDIMGNVSRGPRKLLWTNETLEACVSSGFSRNPSLEHKGIKLERIFNVRGLSRLAGIKIEATNNLLDHLRLTNEDTKLHIFHHASFLNRQPQSSLLPDGLAHETLRTLALLFPQADSEDIQWYSRLPSPFSLDPELMRCGHLTADDRQLEHFEYWHDRLVVLKQVFDEASPKKLSQLWFDRRNSVQWYTFWVAILILALTLITGIIQSVASIMQVYAAFRPGDAT